MPTGKVFLTPKEVAQRLGLHVGTVRRAMRLGGLPSVVVLSRRLMRAKDLMAIERRGMGTSGAHGVARPIQSEGIK